jgi:hypothetical protein
VTNREREGKGSHKGREKHKQTGVIADNVRERATYMRARGIRAGEWAGVQKDR